MIGDIESFMKKSGIKLHSLPFEEQGSGFRVLHEVIFTHRLTWREILGK
jgi:hypothetical protein